MPQPQVRIYNPKSRNGYTSRKSAQRSVERGRARWRPDGSVEFIDDPSDYRAAAVIVSMERLSAMGYDRDVSRGSRASFDAIQGLPVIGDPVKLFTQSRTMPFRPDRLALPLRRLGLRQIDPAPVQESR